MFFKRFRKANTQPQVKKASQFINSSSHKQKKYISLMVVPSYSTGKTRTLRVPRGLFHGVIIAMLVISAVVLGFFLQANHFQRVAQDLGATLEETETRYTEFRTYAEQVQDDLIEAAAQIYEELGETEQRARAELNRQARTHQSELEYILDQIDDIERIIREFDNDIQTIIEGLNSRADVIPPIFPILQELLASHEELRQNSLIHNPQDVVYVPVSGAGLLSAGGQDTVTQDTVTQDALQLYLDILMAELAVQRKMMDTLEFYKSQMTIYLRNYPTLWPVAAPISSGFGWRSNPFGGGSSEFHTGVDIPSPTGTHIYAAGGGIVTHAEWRNGFGLVVQLYHGGGISTMYAHNSSNLVSVGQEVSRGDIIAHVGSTGRSTAPHVHFEVHIDGVQVNPVSFMREYS